MALVGDGATITAVGLVKSSVYWMRNGSRRPLPPDADPIADLERAFRKRRRSPNGARLGVGHADHLARGDLKLPRRLMHDGPCGRGRADGRLRPSYPGTCVLEEQGGFGASAPYKTLYEYFGITAEKAAQAALDRLKR